MITARRGAKSPNRGPDVHELSPAARWVRDRPNAAVVRRSAVPAAAKPGCRPPKGFYVWTRFVQMLAAASMGNLRPPRRPHEIFLALKERLETRSNRSITRLEAVPVNSSNRFGPRNISRHFLGGEARRTPGRFCSRGTPESRRAGRRGIPGHTGCLRYERHFAPKGCRRARGPAAGRVEWRS